MQVRALLATLNISPEESHVAGGFHPSALPDSAANWANAFCEQTGLVSAVPAGAAPGSDWAAEFGPTTSGQAPQENWAAQFQQMHPNQVIKSGYVFRFMYVFVYNG